MTLRVYIQEQMVTQTLDVAIINHQPETVGHLLLRFQDGVERWELIAPEDYGSGHQPSLRLPLEAGPALLDALMRHFHGAEDTRALRQDYERERKRVDEQAQLIADVLRTVVGKAAGS